MSIVQTVAAFDKIEIETARPLSPCDDIPHRIAAGFAAGMKEAEVASFAHTNTYEVRKLRHMASIQALESVIKAAIASSQVQIIQDTKKDFTDKLKSMRPKIAKVYDGALDIALKNGSKKNGLSAFKVGLQAAEAVTDRLDGKAKQLIEQSGSTTETHVVVNLPPEAIHRWLNQQKAVSEAQKPPILIEATRVDDGSN